MRKIYPIIIINIILTTLFGCAAIRDFMRDPDEQQEAPRNPRLAMPMPSDPSVLHVGMEMNEVVNAWGEPWDVQIAGDPSRGNQKWSYFTGLQSRWERNPARVVYFEAGQVVGWDTSSN